MTDDSERNPEVLCLLCGEPDPVHAPTCASVHLAVLGPQISAHDRAWFIAQAEAATDDQQRLWLRPSEVLALARPAVPALDEERLAKALENTETQWRGAGSADYMARRVAAEYAALRSKEPTE